MIESILWPIKWVIELILRFFHSAIVFFGANPASGLSWALAIIGLVLIIRTALIPLFLKQIRSSRKMMELAPEVKRIQDKYRNKRDNLSRQAMSRELMELYRVNKTSPFSSCLPVLLQMPIFFGLYQVIEFAQRGGGIGPLQGAPAEQFRDSKLFGIISLHDSLGFNFGELMEGRPFNLATIVLASILTIFMTAVQFINQLQLVSKNVPESTKNTSIYKNQRIMLYILPLMFIFMGFAFPIGILIYWSTSNTWSAVQQGIVVYRNPTPGSQAFRERQQRLKLKGKLDETVNEAKAVQKTQRQQPVSKKRTKKK